MKLEDFSKLKLGQHLSWNNDSRKPRQIVGLHTRIEEGNLYQCLDVDFEGDSYAYDWSEIHPVVSIVTPKKKMYAFINLGARTPCLCFKEKPIATSATQLRALPQFDIEVDGVDDIEEDV